MFAIAEHEREEKQVTEYLLNNVENILLNGTQLILNEVLNLWDLIKLLLTKKHKAIEQLFIGEFLGWSIDKVREKGVFCGTGFLQEEGSKR